MSRWFDRMMDFSMSASLEVRARIWLDSGVRKMSRALLGFDLVGFRLMRPAFSCIEPQDSMDHFPTLMMP